MTAQTDFMATWRDLRQQQLCTDIVRKKHVQQLMQSLLEQYGSELKQSELNECVADLDGLVLPTSATGHHRSG